MPVFQRYDSFYRLVAKACAPNRDDRFVSADELRSQMVGVLREVVALDRGSGAATTTVSSLLFDVPTPGVEPDDWRNLPALRRDPHDPQTGVADDGVRPPGGAAGDAQASRSAHDGSTARAGAHGPRREQARRRRGHGGRAAERRPVGVARRLDPGARRARAWRLPAAQAAFNAVYGQVPGELAPKLALAQASEQAGDDAVAENLYIACARTDATYVPMAAFGVARIRAARKDVDGAVAAYRLVPVQSSAYRTARAGLAELLARANRGLPDLAEALRTLDDTSLSARRRAELTTLIYREALVTVEKSGNKADVRLGEHKGTPNGLRLGLEEALRELAKRTPDLSERVPLVDEANAIRPWSLW